MTRILLDHLAHDLRTAARGLRNAPTFAVTAVLILGLGIGMSVAMSNVYHAVLLHRLPVVDQDRVVVLWTWRDPAVEFGTLRRDLVGLARDSRTMRDVAGVAHWGSTPFPVIDGDRPVLLNRAVVTGNFFDVLAARPVLGRLLRAEDEVNGAARVIVLSYRAWQREFAGDSAIVGRRLVHPYLLSPAEVVGVAPPGRALRGLTDTSNETGQNRHERQESIQRAIGG